MGGFWVDDASRQASRRSCIWVVAGVVGVWGCSILIGLVELIILVHIRGLGVDFEDKFDVNIESGRRGRYPISDGGGGVA